VSATIVGRTPGGCVVRFESSITIGMRVLVLFAGVFVMMFGLGLRAVEREHGAGLTFTTEARSDGVWVVYEVDEFTAAKTRVYAGTRDQALDYVDDRRNVAEDTFPSNVIVAVGIVLVIGAFGAGWHRPPVPYQRARGTPGGAVPHGS
jgi:hypothetical protein